MSLNEELNATTGPGKVSRRTLAVGAAWSVPVIAAASAAPAMAASGPIRINFTGVACKHPGEPKWYHFKVTITNSSASSITVTFIKLNVNSVDGPQVLPTSVPVPGPGSVTTTVDGGLFGDSANGTAVLYFSYVVGVQTINDSVSTSFNDLNPCGTGNANSNPNGWQEPSGNPPH